MRIEGPNSTSSTERASKTKKSSSSSSSSFSSLVSSMHEQSDVDDSSDVAMSSSVGSLDALLAVQEDGGRGSHDANERMKQRADDILDRLEGVKNSILAGTISENELVSIRDLVHQQREMDIAPELASILDEIELRAEVELAKLDKSLV